MIQVTSEIPTLVGPSLCLVFSLLRCRNVEGTSEGTLVFPREFVNTRIIPSNLMERMTERPEDTGRNLLEGLIEALANKQSQVDLTFNRTSLRFPGTAVGMEINGAISLVVHMRELTDEEKQILASKNVATLSGNSTDKEIFSPLK